MTNVMENRHSAEGKLFYMTSFIKARLLAWPLIEFYSKSAILPLQCWVQEYSTADLVILKFHSVETVTVLY